MQKRSLHNKKYIEKRKRKKDKGKKEGKRKDGKKKARQGGGLVPGEGGEMCTAPFVQAEHCSSTALASQKHEALCSGKF